MTPPQALRFSTGWRGALLVLLGLFAILYVANLILYSGYLLDDTFISLRYARNLAEGHGLVFNPGERVEGYTNFLLVLIAALFIKLGIDPVTATSRLSLLAALWSLFVLVRLERIGSEDAEDAGLPPLSLLLLLPAPTFAYWSVSGMETMLFCAFLLTGVLLAALESRSGRPRGCVLVFLLLSLTRPEGVLCFFVCTLGFFVVESWRERSRSSFPRHLKDLAVFAVAYGLYFLWRWSYYGHPFPNTLTAKFTGGTKQLRSGVFYLGAFASAFPLQAMALGALVGACLVAPIGGYLASQPERAFVASRTAVVGKEVGEWLRARLPAEALIAVNTAGALPYYSRLPAIDMLGLTDEKIAQRPVFVVTPGWAGHRRGWGDYVLARKPAVILFYNSAGSREPFGHAPSGQVRFADLGLVAHFHENPIQYTTFEEGSILLNTFELDGRDEPLWGSTSRDMADLDRFLDGVVERWSRDTLSAPSPDASARADVEARCQRAYELIQARSYDAAKRLLAETAERNATARSPLVYQYIANLAVMTGDLFVAIPAQKAALRFAPESALYKANLARLLRIPYEQARESALVD